MRDRAAAAWDLLRRGAISMKDAEGNRDAAQLAYYLVMSFPALLLLAVWGFSSLLGDPSVREPIVDAIVQALPIADPNDRAEVERMLDDVAAGAGSLGWVGAIALLYSASGALGATRRAVNAAWGRRDARPFVPAKAMDAGLTIVAAPLLIGALGLALVGDGIVVTRLLPLALSLAALTGLYAVLPDSRRASWRSALPGAFVAVVGIVLIQVGTELSFKLFGDSNAVYGTMGILLALVFSAYLIALAVIFGAHVSAAAGLPPDPVRDGPPQTFGQTLVGALRGLFVRRKPPTGGPSRSGGAPPG